MTTFNKLIEHLKFQGKRDEMVKMMKEAVKDMNPGNPQTLSILYQLAFFSGKQIVDRETEDVFREMLEKYTRTLGADHSSTLSVSKILDLVAMSTKLFKRFAAIKRLFGANHPNTLKLSTMIMTYITNTDKEIDDRLGLPPAPEGDAEERRWNDENSRGWDDELHRRLVSTIARYKEKVQNGPQCDRWEQILVSCYCPPKILEER